MKNTSSSNFAQYVDNLAPTRSEAYAVLAERYFQSELPREITYALVELRQRRSRKGSFPSSSTLARILRKEFGESAPSRRARAFELFQLGRTNREVANVLGVVPRTILRYRDEFVKGGASAVVAESSDG